MDRVLAAGKIRKRKAEHQDNERLSKRLSLLNLEHNGQKLYVPVENPAVTTSSKPPAPKQENDSMQLDDTKHKVYIYNLDDELSDSESDDGKLVFLPDIEKHLRTTRIPPSILANSDGELAGNNQLVLYNIPSSLTVPKEQDSVRKAIIETRARARIKQDQKRDADIREAQATYASINADLEARDYSNHVANGTTIGGPVMQESMEDDPDAMDLG